MEIQLIQNYGFDLPSVLSHADGWCADFQQNSFTGGVKVAEGTTITVGRPPVLMHTHTRDLLVLRFSQDHPTSNAWLEITGTSVNDPENRRFFLMCNDQGLGFDFIDDDH